MNRKSLRIIILLAAISLSGVLAVQIYWVQKAFDLEENQFNQRVHTALTNVAKEIMSIRQESEQLFEPVKQIGSNYFIASINDTLHPFLLHSLLLEEFELRNIKVDFEYVIYDCFTDSIVYSKFISYEKVEDDGDKELKGLKWQRDGHYFGVYFPGKASYLIGQMGIWIFSTSILLIVMIYFAYTMFVILRQKKLSEIRTDFINNLTHEFKTPISTISLSTDVILNEETLKNPNKIAQYAQIIKQENNRLKIQVDKVLQLATLDVKTIVLRKESHDAHKLINEAVKGFSLLLSERNGNIKLNLNASKSIIITDSLHFTNIVYNLIDNAIKYSSESPEIEISTSFERRNFCLTIRDKGIGIEKSQQKHIFDKFYRVPTGNLHDVKGFGLGLSYVKSIVELHGGKILLKSEIGKGSEFILEIPVEE